MATKTVYKGVVAVGCPVELDGDLYNCAVLMQGGKYLGVVPKSYLPTYGEFDESRWFRHGRKIKNRSIILNGQEVRMGVDLLFQAVDFPGSSSAWKSAKTAGRSSRRTASRLWAALFVFLNLSASNELAGKDDYRREHLLKPHPARPWAATPMRPPARVKAPPTWFRAVTA